MTKLLYVPSGEYIQFLKALTPNKGIEYTTCWESSQWFLIWEETIEDAIIQFCRPESEASTKTKHRIPLNTDLSPNEFEIVKEDNELS